MQETYDRDVCVTAENDRYEESSGRKIPRNYSFFELVSKWREEIRKLRIEIFFSSFVFGNLRKLSKPTSIDVKFNFLGSGVGNLVIDRPKCPNSRKQLLEK